MPYNLLRKFPKEHWVGQAKDVKIGALLIHDNKDNFMNLKKIVTTILPTNKEKKQAALLVVGKVSSLTLGWGGQGTEGKSRTIWLV